MLWYLRSIVSHKTKPHIIIKSSIKAHLSKLTKPNAFKSLWSNYRSNEQMVSSIKALVKSQNSCQNVLMLSWVFCTCVWSMIKLNIKYASTTFVTNEWNQQSCFVANSHELIYSGTSTSTLWTVSSRNGYCVGKIITEWKQSEKNNAIRVVRLTAKS